MIPVSAVSIAGFDILTTVPGVKRHLKSERGYKVGARLISACQGLIMTLGLLGCCYLAVYQVINKTRTPGEFVQLLTYWAQLRGETTTIEILLLFS